MKILFCNNATCTHNSNHEQFQHIAADSMQTCTNQTCTQRDGSSALGLGSPRAGPHRTSWSAAGCWEPS